MARAFFVLFFLNVPTNSKWSQIKSSFFVTLQEVFTVLITCLSVSITTTFLLAIINFHITASTPDWGTQQCLDVYYFNVK